MAKNKLFNPLHILISVIAFVSIIAIAPSNFAQGSDYNFVSTFHSINLYWSQVDGSYSRTVSVQYRPSDDSSWYDGSPMWYSQGAEEYRGILTNLTPSTMYDIKMTLNDTGESVSFQAATRIAPWVTQIPPTVAPVVNQPPTINAIGTQNNQVGDSVNLQVFASDPEGLSLRYDDASSLPTGLTLDAASGFIRGVVAAGASGTYDVTITVIDSEGLRAQQGFDWVITNAPTTGDDNQGSANSSDQSKVVTYDPRHISDSWQRYQNDYMEFVTVNGRDAMRIVSNAQTRDTYSEGQAYGMLFAVLMNDQTLYDLMWRYAQAYFNNNGLMHWRIASSGQVAGTGAATDADVDMAMSLIYACRRVQVGDWQSTNDYCASAQTMINAIWTHEIDKSGSQPASGLNNNQGYELIPGDSWCLECDYPNGIINLSYFSPAYFTAFASFTGNSGWELVNTRNYDVMRQSQSLDCSRLVPNWSTYQGQVQTVPWHGHTSAYWGWDAARVSWRVALSSFWYRDERAVEVLNDIGGFFDGVGLENVRSEYRLNGSPVNSYSDTFFVAHAANAIWGMSSPNRSSCNNVGSPRNTSRQQGYDAVYNRAYNNYYNDSWRLLSLMLMTGYFNNPDEAFVLTDASGKPNPVPPTQEPVVIPTQIPTQVPDIPTQVPTQEPVVVPTQIPTQEPVVVPTQIPTQVPVVVPTQVPTQVPVVVPPPSTSGGIRVEQLSTTMNNQQVQFQLRVSNTSQQTYNNVSWRFYFQVDAGKSASDYVFEKYWDSTNGAQVSAPQQHAGNIYYVEVRYSTSLAPNATWQYHGAMHLSDWSFGFDANNDWSMSGAGNQFSDTTYIPVYSNGQRIHGLAP